MSALELVVLAYHPKFKPSKW